MFAKIKRFLSHFLVLTLLAGMVLPAAAAELEETGEPPEAAETREAAPAPEDGSGEDAPEAASQPPDSQDPEDPEESGEDWDADWDADWEEDWETEDWEEEAWEEEPVYREMPLYYQDDYPHVRYGNGTIASSGCAVVALAMVASYMTGHTYLPDELAAYFGDQVCNNNMERLEYGSDQLRLPWAKAVDWRDVQRTLEEGGVAIVLVNKKSAFTKSQHFLVLTGLTEDGRVLVHDPYRPNYNLWNLRDGFENGFPVGYLTTGFDGAWLYDVNAMPEDPFIYTPDPVPEVEPRYPDIQLSREETDLLAKMVWVEAQGEPIEGQQAVAEVVLNRMKSGDFSGSLVGVLYAEGQFRSTARIPKAKPNQAQYVAIERALNGPYILDEDVVYFATYPVNESVWGQIGGHIFCYSE